MIYVSISTIPQRIKNLNESVKSLLNLTLKPDKIIINIPNIKKNIFFTNTNKTIFIPNPSTFTFSKKRIKKEKIILTIARLTHQKNIEILIKSFSKSIAFKKKWKFHYIKRERC